MWISRTKKKCFLLICRSSGTTNTLVFNFQPLENRVTNKYRIMETCGWKKKKKKIFRRATKNETDVRREESSQNAYSKREKEHSRPYGVEWLRRNGYIRAQCTLSLEINARHTSTRKKVSGVVSQAWEGLGIFNRNLTSPLVKRLYVRRKENHWKYNKHGHRETRRFGELVQKEETCKSLIFILRSNRIAWERCLCVFWTYFWKNERIADKPAIFKRVSQI